MAASVDQTKGNILRTPLTELATLNSHTVTQNCTASWTTAITNVTGNVWEYETKTLDYVHPSDGEFHFVPEVVFQYNMELMTEIAFSTCKANVSVSFRYWTNISSFFNSPSSPSFSPTFWGVDGKVWLTSEASSSEPEDRERKRMPKTGRKLKSLFSQF